MGFLVPVGQANGQAGQYLTPRGDLGGSASAAVTAGRVILSRFVPDQNYTFKHLTYSVTTASTGPADTGVDVGIYNSGLTTLLANYGGAATNVMTTGPKTLALSSSLTVVAGTVYYAAFQVLTFTGSPAIGQFNTGNNFLTQLPGATAGLAECMYATIAATSLPSSITPTGAIAAGPLIFGATT